MRENDFRRLTYESLKQLSNGGFYLRRVESELSESKLTVRSYIIRETLTLSCLSDAYA